MKGITDLGITTTTTKAQAPLGMVQCYGDTWKRGLYALALMVGVSIETKDFKNLQWKARNRILKLKVYSS